jgi:hypothetical protein
MVILGLCVAAWPRKPISWSSLQTAIVLTLLPEKVWNSVVSVATENRRFIFATCFSTRRSHSVSLCGLPLCGWVGVAPRHFHFIITALTVDRDCSSRAEIWWTDLLERWHPVTVPHWKSEIFSQAILLSMFVYGDCMAVCSILYICQQRVWLK